MTVDELANEILFWFLCSNCLRKKRYSLFYCLATYFYLVSESCTVKTESNFGLTARTRQEYKMSDYKIKKHLTGIKYTRPSHS